MLSRDNRGWLVGCYSNLWDILSQSSNVLHDITTFEIYVYVTFCENNQMAGFIYRFQGQDVDGVICEVLASGSVKIRDCM